VLLTLFLNPTDFSITAKLYGKIIIAEAFLPRKYQTIKPCVVGGLAGGPKYIYNGMAPHAGSLFHLPNPSSSSPSPSSSSSSLTDNSSRHLL
jgi:hypothetical protein